MLNTILGSKKNMQQAFVGENRVPTTVVLAGPCMVTQIKHEDKDGYWAVQLGFGEKKESKINKPTKGHLQPALKAGRIVSGDSKSALVPRYLREVRLSGKSELKVGDSVGVTDVFKVGDRVSVTGTSKGKGFAGVVKRWGFAGGPRTHGQSDRERAPGSIGQGTEIGRVFKGKKMGGRMGTDTVTVQNLQVVNIDESNNELALSGPVPGITGGLLIIKRISSGKLNIQKKGSAHSKSEAGGAKRAQADEEADQGGSDQ